MKLIGWDKINIAEDTREELDIGLTQFDGPEFINRMKSFQFYKICAVKYEYIPAMNVQGYTCTEDAAGSGAAWPVECPTNPMALLFESNTDAAYTNDATGVKRIFQSPRAHVFNPLRKFSIYRRIKPTTNINLGVSTTVRLPFNPRMSTNDLKDVFGKTYIAVQKGVVPAVATIKPFVALGDIKTTYYVTLYNFQNEFL